VNGTNINITFMVWSAKAHTQHLTVRRAL